MNTRQKAKHFKRLYEQQLKSLKHYRIKKAVAGWNKSLMYVDKVALQKLAFDGIARDIIDIAKDNVTETHDDRIDATIYALDVWCRR